MDPVNIKSIPHERQRYPTVGDYYYDIAGKLIIKVSSMKNPDFEFLVAIHEFIEAYLCQKRGIEEPTITRFDVNFERSRIKGNTDEPGDNPEAPYFNEHQFATKIEKVMAKELGVNWKEYEKTVNDL